MHLDYVTVDADRSFADVAERVRRHEERTGRFPVVFVTDDILRLIETEAGETLYESTIAAIAVLAAYMPVVAGMGGNAGTQAMAVTVRGISLGQVSMVVNLVIAGFFGALIPLVLDRLGQDPATSATIFITTATDVLGFFVFLGLAQAVLL